MYMLGKLNSYSIYIIQGVKLYTIYIAHKYSASYNPVIIPYSYGTKMDESLPYIIFDLLTGSLSADVSSCIIVLCILLR